MKWCLNRRYESLFGLLGNDSSLLDFNFLDVLSQTSLNSLDDSGLLSLESEEITSSSDLEFSDLRILLDEDGYIITTFTLFDCLFRFISGFAFL